MPEKTYEFKEKVVIYAMIYSLNPPLSVPFSSEPSEECVIEYAYYREVADERRPARATGSWARVWDRVDLSAAEAPGEER